MHGTKRKAPGRGYARGARISKKIKAAKDGEQPITQDAYTVSNGKFESDANLLEEPATSEQDAENDDVPWYTDNDVIDGAKASTIRSGHDPGRKQQPNKATESSRAKQKTLLQERKANKAHAEMIVRAKRIWEKLRVGSIPLAERKQLIEELFDIVNGRVKEFVLKHDAGRIIQTALKYGNKAQRRAIATELRGEYKQLAASKYAKFTIGKLLSNRDEEVRDMIISEFYGHVRTLIKHPEAGWILDDVYRGAATKSQKARLLREWYGSDFAIFEPSEGTPTHAELSLFLKDTPQRRGSIMKYLFELINLLIQKRTTGFTMLHDAMLQYYLNMDYASSAANEFMTMVTEDEEGNLAKNLAFTASGSYLVSLLLARGSAKDRKNLLKSYKGHISALAYDSNGHRVLLTSLEVIDDTVLTSKLIYGELIHKSNPELDNIILEMLQHTTARALMLLPFAHNPATVLTVRSKTLFDEIKDIRATTSRKDPNMRLLELKRAICPFLLSLVASHALELLRSTFGCVCIQEVLLSSPASDRREYALDALIDILTPLAREPPNSEGLVSLNAAIDAPAATRMLKALVYSGHYDGAVSRVKTCPEPLGFASKLYRALFSGNDSRSRLLKWATGVRAFVVEAMLQSEDMPTAYKEQLLESLRICRKELQEAANASDQQNNSKTKSHLSRSAGDDRKGKETANASVRVGSKGAQMILELLDHNR